MDDDRAIGAIHPERVVGLPAIGIQTGRGEEVVDDLRADSCASELHHVFGLKLIFGESVVDVAHDGVRRDVLPRKLDDFA